MADTPDLADVLYPIELAVLEAWEREPSLLDLEVADVFDALARRYTLEERGQTSRGPSLSPKAALVFETVSAVSEAQIGRQPPPQRNLRIAFRTDVTAAELARGFKRLSRSVATWSERGGRQGYLEYISELLPR
jgi:hypothetical protein